MRADRSFTIRPRYAKLVQQAANRPAANFSKCSKAGRATARQLSVQPEHQISGVNSLAPTLLSQPALREFPARPVSALRVSA